MQSTLSQNSPSSMQRRDVWSSSSKSSKAPALAFATSMVTSILDGSQRHYGILHTQAHSLSHYIGEPQLIEGLQFAADTRCRGNRTQITGLNQPAAVHCAFNVSIEWTINLCDRRQRRVGLSQVAASVPRACVRLGKPPRMRTAGWYRRAVSIGDNRTAALLTADITDD